MSKEQGVEVLRLMQEALTRYVPHYYLPESNSGNFVVTNKPLVLMDEPDGKLVNATSLLAVASFLASMVAIFQEQLEETKRELNARVRANIALAAENEKLQSIINPSAIDERSISN